MLHEDMPEMRSVVHTSLKYLHVLFSKIKSVVKYQRFQSESIYML